MGGKVHIYDRRYEPLSTHRAATVTTATVSYPKSLVRRASPRGSLPARPRRSLPMAAAAAAAAARLVAAAAAAAAVQ